MSWVVKAYGTGMNVRVVSAPEAQCPPIALSAQFSACTKGEQRDNREPPEDRAERRSTRAGTRGLRGRRHSRLDVHEWALPRRKRGHVANQLPGDDRSPGACRGRRRGVEVGCRV